MYLFPSTAFTAGSHFLNANKKEKKKTKALYNESYIPVSGLRIKLKSFFFKCIWVTLVTEQLF